MAWTGTGTIGDPYQITTEDELVDATGSTDANEHLYYILTTDLDLQSYYPWIPLGVSYPSGPYDYPKWNASLEGNNHTISNLQLDVVSHLFDTENDSALIGLFSRLECTGSGHVRNLNIESCSANFHVTSSNISATSIDSSILAGSSYYYDILNVHIRNVNISINIDNTSTTQNYEFSVFGKTRRGNILSCSIENASLNFYRRNDGNNFTDISLFSSFIISTQSFNYIKNCDIEFNSVYNDLSPDSEQIFAVYSNTAYGTVNDCYILNTTVTSSNNDVCALFADIYATASNVYTYVNFLNTPSSLIHPLYIYDNNYFVNCHYQSGSYTFDYPQTNNGVTGSTITQLQNSESFAGWDFVNIWKQNNMVNDGYPYFRYQEVTPLTPTFTIIYPNGGELFYYNQIVPISWTFSSGTL
jgi:hypothetical protein